VPRNALVLDFDKHRLPFDHFPGSSNRNTLTRLID
jgi:hypothetical protein